MAVTRPELGPTLPGALRERFGIPPLVTLVVAGAIAVAAVAVIISTLGGPSIWGEQVVRKGPPAFNMIYPGDAMRVAAPQGDQLLRLEGFRKGLHAEVTVEPLDLPRFDGDVTHGLLPVYADRFVEQAKRDRPGLELTQEGRARVNNGVGYEVGYGRDTADERFSGRQVLLVPDDPEEGRGAVLLSMTLESPGGRKLTPPERNLAYLARKAYRSFRFGTERG
jgi:hypothetical protein